MVTFVQANHPPQWVYGLTIGPEPYLVIAWQLEAGKHPHPVTAEVLIEADETFAFTDTYLTAANDLDWLRRKDRMSTAGLDVAGELLSTATPAQVAAYRTEQAAHSAETDRVRRARLEQGNRHRALTAGWEQYDALMNGLGVEEIIRTDVPDLDERTYLFLGGAGNPHQNHPITTGCLTAPTPHQVLPVHQGNSVVWPACRWPHLHPAPTTQPTPLGPQMSDDFADPIHSTK